MGQPRLIWVCPKQISTHSLAQGNTLLLRRAQHRVWMGYGGRPFYGVWNISWGPRPRLYQRPSRRWQVGGGRMFVNSFSLSVGWECGLTILARGVLAGLEVSILRLRSYLDRDHHCSNTALPLMNLVIHTYFSLQLYLDFCFPDTSPHWNKVMGVLKVSILWLRSYSDKDHHCSNSTLLLMNLGIRSTTGAFRYDDWWFLYKLMCWMPCHNYAELH